mgnify:CR=1 FL=1
MWRGNAIKLDRMALDDPAVGSADRLFDEAALAACLQRQLDRPLMEDLGAGAFASGLTPWRGATFANLLHHPEPPLPLLELTRQFAKTCRPPHSQVPIPVGMVLYFAAIATALLRCGRRITRLDDQGIRRGLKWALAQRWLDPALRDRFEQAMRLVQRPLPLPAQR